MMLEFPVEPETAPFLVTSTKALLWVPEAHHDDVVKAAVREAALGSLFMEILDEVTKKGKEAQWGNVHLFSQAGVQAAIDHVRYYDLEDLEILAPPNREEDHKDGVYKRPQWLNDMKLPLRPTSWLPEGCVVVLPKDRKYVGFVGYLTRTSCVAVVHNASRGIAIARGSG